MRFIFATGSGIALLDCIHYGSAFWLVSAAILAAAALFF